MKMIGLWALIAVVVGFKVKRIDRWVVLSVFAACAADVAFAYLTF